MKKYSYFVWALAVFASLTACTQEDLLDVDESSSYDGMVRFKTEFCTQSRTSFNYDFTGLDWTEGDVIGLFSDANDINIKSTPVDENGCFNANISSKAKKVYAYYPYSTREPYNDVLNGDVDEYLDTEIPVSINYAQKQYKKGVFNGENLPILAEAELSDSMDKTTTLQFRPLASICSFKVYNSLSGDEKLQSITLSSRKMCGDYAYDYSTGEFKSFGTRPDHYKATVGLNYDYRIPSNKPTGKDNNVYLVVSPLNYTYLTIIVSTDKNIYSFSIFPAQFDMTDVYNVKQLSINLANATSVEKNYQLTSNDIPDNKFMQHLLEKHDVNGDNAIYFSEAINTDGLEVSSKGIRSLKGIEYFRNLQWLHCEHNDITELDLSRNTQISYLQLGYNKLTSLNLRGIGSLGFFKCDNNQLTGLDLSDSKGMCWFSAMNNNLQSMNFFNHHNLQYVNLYNNQLTSLVLEGVEKKIFRSLNVKHNKLVELDLSRCPFLSEIDVSDNNLKTLNVSNCNKDMGVVYVDPQYEYGTSIFVDRFLFVRAEDQSFRTLRLPEITEIKEVNVPRN